MKIHLTSQEYRLLLDLLYIADWVMHAHEVGDVVDCTNHDMLVQKLYSYAAEAGCAGLVLADHARNDYLPTKLFEDTSPAREIIDSYDDDTFWDELSERLAERDLTDERGGGVQDLSFEDYYRLTAPIREMYEQEFAEHGIERLRIVEG